MESVYNTPNGIKQGVNMPKYITTKEAAAIMDVTERYVRMKVKSGEIAGRRWGRDWQVDEKAAREFERERKHKTPKP